MSIRKYIAKHLSDRDPEDFIFKIFKGKGGYQPIYIGPKTDIEEGHDVVSWRQLEELKLV